MKNELKINGFSAVTENEMMDVDGGSAAVVIRCIVIVAICLCLQGSEVK